jgi:hypothetical protein
MKWQNRAGNSNASSDIIKDGSSAKGNNMFRQLGVPLEVKEKEVKGKSGSIMGKD